MKIYSCVITTFYVAGLFAGDVEVPLRRLAGQLEELAGMVGPAPMGAYVAEVTLPVVDVNFEILPYGAQFRLIDTWKTKVSQGRVLENIKAELEHLTSVWNAEKDKAGLKVRMTQQVDALATTIVQLKKSILAVHTRLKSYLDNVVKVQNNVHHKNIPEGMKNIFFTSAGTNKGIKEAEAMLKAYMEPLEVWKKECDDLEKRLKDLRTSITKIPL